MTNTKTLAELRTEHAEGMADPATGFGALWGVANDLIETLEAKVETLTSALTRYVDHDHCGAHELDVPGCDCDHCEGARALGYR